MTDAFTRQTFNRQLLRALYIPFLLLVLCPFIGYLVVGHLAEVVRLDRHSIEVIGETNELEKLFIDLETGVRGFQLTGEAAFLEPYDAARKAVPAQFEHVKEAVVDNAGQLQRLEVVRRDYEDWNAFATEAINRARNGFTRDRAFHASGKALMDRTRADMAIFLVAERQLLDERSRSVGPAKQEAILWFAGLFVAAMVLVLWWTWTQMRRLAGTYEESLRATELEKERFRVTLASIGDAVIVTDRNGAVNFLNSEAERMTGWSLAEARGHPLRTVFRIINEESRQPVDDPVEKVFKEHRVVGLANHTVLISKAGAEWMIEDSASPIFDAERKISGVVLVFQDAGVRRRAQKAMVEARDEAVAASQAKDDFLAALSHELRTPLNPVLLLASDNSNRPELPEDVRQDFTMIAKNVMLESRLIDDLLDLTRISNRKLSLDLEVIDVRDVLREAVEKVAAEVSEKGLRLEAHLGTGPAWIKGDATRLQQVFWNVLKNAVKFTPAGGLVKVEAALAPGGQAMTVAISDTGFGTDAVRARARLRTLCAGTARREKRGAPVWRTRTWPGNRAQHHRTAWRFHHGRESGPGPGRDLHDQAGADGAVPRRPAASCKSDGRGREFVAAALPDPLCGGPHGNPDGAGRTVAQARLPDNRGRYGVGGTHVSGQRAVRFRHLRFGAAGW